MSQRPDPDRAADGTGGPDDGPGPAAWLTATVRPAGPLDGDGARRLRSILDALAACASIVVLDLEAARLENRATAGAIDAAACALESRGGTLLCVHADAPSRRVLAGAAHAVVVDA